MNGRIGTGNWWNDTDRLKLEYSERNLSPVSLCPPQIPDYILLASLFFSLFTKHLSVAGVVYWFLTQASELFDSLRVNQLLIAFFILYVLVMDVTGHTNYSLGRKNNFTTSIQPPISVPKIYIQNMFGVQHRVVFAGYSSKPVCICMTCLHMLLLNFLV
jgi:hypothetical protein